MQNGIVMNCSEPDSSTQNSKDASILESENNDNGPESEDGPIHSGGNIILQIKSDIEIILSLKVDFNFTQEFQECEGIFLHYWKAS